MKYLKMWFIGLGLAIVSLTAQAQEVEAPNAMIERVSGEVLELLKTDQKLRSGNIDYIVQVVNDKLLPHMNFPRMAAMTVGQPWRSATAEQKAQVQEEFKMMLIRTYAGALDQVNQNVTIVVLPFRMATGDTEVLVRTEVRGQGNPVELSYRLRLEQGGWKVYNVNVAGVWMVENYRSQYQPILNKSGIDGLIKTLREMNAAS